MSLQVLFLDLNSYFASVEQQTRPELRERPVAVAAVESPSGCCIAASIEAKRRGVKTGTRVGEARRLCPGIIVVRARHRLYVEYHERTKEAVNRVIPIGQVHSIDELSCILDPRDRTPDRAVRVARHVKESLRRHLGEWVLGSIGLAPNRLLAKVATDMQKPDGLVVIRREDLPGAILGLTLQDLPGIGRRMDQRLRGLGINTVADLWACSEARLGEVWGSMVGRRWWYWLRGQEIALPATRLRSIGHQHVLAPAMRSPEHAWSVAVKLLHRAAARLRYHRRWARRLFLGVEVGSQGWGSDAGLGDGTQDTIELLRVLRTLWAARPPGRPSFVSVVLSDLAEAGNTSRPLFSQEVRRSDLMAAIDRINAQHAGDGRSVIHSASMLPSRDAAPGGIAFSSIPSLDIPGVLDAPAPSPAPPRGRAARTARRWGTGRDETPSSGPGGA